MPLFSGISDLALTLGGLSSARERRTCLLRRGHRDDSNTFEREWGESGELGEFLRMK